MQNNEKDTQQNMFTWGYEEETSDVFDGYKVRSPIAHWKKLGWALMGKSTRLEELRVERKMLEHKIAVMSYIKSLEYITYEQRRLACMTYWRMPIAFVDTPFYTRTYEILAENPAQVCMMPEVLRELKPGEKYEMTVFVKEADQKTAEIMDPYFTGTVETDADLRPFKGALARVGFTYVDEKVYIVSAVKSGVPFEAGRETISLKREKDLPYLNSRFYVYSVLNVANLFGDLCLQNYREVREIEIKNGELEPNSAKDVAKPAFYLAMVDYRGVAMKDKKAVQENGLYHGFLNKEFLEAHKNDRLNRFTLEHPADELPPYREVRAYEEFSDDIAFVHGTHVSMDNKIYVTRELRIGPDTTKSTAYKTPVLFNMALSQEPFMR